MDDPNRDLRRLLDEPVKGAVESALRLWLPRQRWFGGKARKITAVAIEDAIGVADRRGALLAAIEYDSGAGDCYLLAVSLGPGEEKDHILSLPSGEALRDAIGEPDFAREALELIAEGRQLSTAQGGLLVAWPTRDFHELATAPWRDLEPKFLGLEQSNSSIRFGDRYMLKLFRRLAEGVSPDLEINTYLTEVARFEHSPPMLGGMEYRRPGRPPRAVAILQQFVPNRGDAWRLTLECLAETIERLTCAADLAPPSAGLLPSEPLLLHDAEAQTPPEARVVIGDYLGWAKLLGRRTGELHGALSLGGSPEFQSEPFDSRARAAFVAAARRNLARTCVGLKEHLPRLPESARPLAAETLELTPTIENRYSALEACETAGKIIRCHGDYHLGQTLVTSDDIYIIDFEGEPSRSLDERRRKHSPLKDVAGMLRSFDYARHAALATWTAAHGRPASPALVAWLGVWRRWVSAEFLRSYLAASRAANLMPEDAALAQSLLDAHLLEKAVYELDYEINHRPDWAPIPLTAIRELA